MTSMEQYTESWCRSSDGTDIFYSISGPNRPTTEPDVVLSDGIGCDGFVWKYLAPELAKRHRVIRYHYRGHGRSSAPADMENLSMEHLVDDMQCVLERVGVDRPAILAGHSMGVQVIFEAHRRMPERVAALIPICGSYGNPLDTFHDGEMLKKAFPYLYRLFTGFPEAAMRLWRALLPSQSAYWMAVLMGEVNRSLMRMDDISPYFSHLSQINGEVFIRMLHLVSTHTARDHLPSIEIPTLVVAAENDTFTPAWLSREMRDLIPGADILMIARGSHAAPLEQPELVALRIEKFLTERLGCYAEAVSAPEVQPDDLRPALKVVSKRPAAKARAAKKPAARTKKAKTAETAKGLSAKAAKKKPRKKKATSGAARKPAKAASKVMPAAAPEDDAKVASGS